MLEWEIQSVRAQLEQVREEIRCLKVRRPDPFDRVERLHVLVQTMANLHWKWYELAAEGTGRELARMRA
jgi:hypothetical protein